MNYGIVLVWLLILFGFYIIVMLREFASEMQVLA